MFVYRNFWKPLVLYQNYQKDLKCNSTVIPQKLWLLTRICSKPCNPTKLEKIATILPEFLENLVLYQNE